MLEERRMQAWAQPGTQRGRNSVDGYSRAVGEQFGRALCDRRRGKAHIHHGIGPERACLFQHALNGFLARFLQELGVAFQFTADDVLEPGENIPSDVLCPDSAPGDKSVMLADGSSGHAFKIGEKEIVRHKLRLDCGRLQDAATRLPASIIHGTRAPNLIAGKSPQTGADRGTTP